MNLDDIEWREDLPDRCPPENAAEPAPQTLIRLLDCATPTDGDFDSHLALGLTCNDEKRLCEWASCSMFLSSFEKHQIIALRKFKRLKNKTHVAFVEINADSGRVQVKPTKHVDVWMYKTFSPTDNVVKVVEAEQYEPS